MIVVHDFTAGILAKDTCENNGSPLEGTYQKCQCPSGFKGYDCSEKGICNRASKHCSYTRTCM